MSRRSTTIHRLGGTYPQGSPCGAHALPTAFGALSTVKTHGYWSSDPQALTGTIKEQSLSQSQQNPPIVGVLREGLAEDAPPVSGGWRCGTSARR